MPVPAQWAEIRFAAPLDAHKERRVQRIALRAIAPLAGAHALPFFAGRLFHARKINVTGGKRDGRDSLHWRFFARIVTSAVGRGRKNP
jgi:hypothetical protein